MLKCLCASNASTHFVIGTYICHLEYQNNSMISCWTKLSMFTCSADIVMLVLSTWRRRNQTVCTRLTYYLIISVTYYYIVTQDVGVRCRR